MNEKEIMNKLNTYKKYYILYFILFASGIIIEILPGFFLLRVNYTIILLIGVIIMLSGAIGMEHINYQKYKILKPEIPLQNYKNSAKNYADISGFLFIVGGFFVSFFLPFKVNINALLPAIIGSISGITIMVISKTLIASNNRINRIYGGILLITIASIASLFTLFGLFFGIIFAIIALIILIKNNNIKTKI